MNGKEEEENDQLYTASILDEGRERKGGKEERRS